MWGTTSFCDELTDDFGGPFEGTSIDNCRLFGRLAEIQSHGVLGLLQHYRHLADLAVSGRMSAVEGRPDFNIELPAPKGRAP